MPDVAMLIRSLAENYGKCPESLLPILQGVMNEYKYVSEEAMVEIARELDISAARVYGTATFYSFVNTKPVGKYIIRVCKTITCSMHGKNLIVQEIENMLKIKLGETTRDGRFTLLETNCLGHCHKGPAMLINEQPYTELTPEKIRNILQELN